MAIYITQGNYSEKAIKGMVDNPEDRMNAVAGLMKSVGSKLLNYYVTTGEYDFLVISEGDNLTDLFAGMMIAGSTGGVKNLKTIEGMTTLEAVKSMEKAKAVRDSFKPAG